MIRDKARKTGELNGILYVSESDNSCLAREIYARTGNRKTDLFEIGIYDGSYYLNFSPFFNREETFFKRYNRVSLSNSGKKVTDDLFRLFEAEGVSVRFSFERTEKPPLILHYEIK